MTEPQKKSIRSLVRRRRLIGVGVVVVAVMAWFVCVDWSWFVEGCPNCGFGRDVVQYRVCGIVVREETKEFQTIAEFVARDLGTPCSHIPMNRWHKHRWWGLCYCQSPCINGIDRLTQDESWYDAAVQSRVQALAATDPAVRDEFKQRIIVGRDATWWQTFWPRVGLPAEPPAH